MTPQASGSAAGNSKGVREWLGRVGVKTLFIEPGSPWTSGLPQESLLFRVGVVGDAPLLDRQPDPRRQCRSCG
jgi:hypothetical protein